MFTNLDAPICLKAGGVSICPFNAFVAIITLKFLSYTSVFKAVRTCDISTSVDCNTSQTFFSLSFKYFFFYHINFLILMTLLY